MAIRSSVSAKLWLAVGLLSGIISAGLTEANAGGESRAYTIAADLQAAIDRAAPYDTLIIGKGIYEANPKSYRESICGNCVEALTWVQATAGFHIKGKPLILIGEDRDSTILITNAGYGILFDGSPGSRIANLTITGGVRDPDGNATDAGIVVKDSRVTVERVTIKDNTSRIDTVVVGIGGIFGREGSEILIRDNLIANNGWDGVALYRGSNAVIADNVIQQGRGAGIGITWDARAQVHRNRISGYWKGIGAFGTTWVSARNNIVSDNLGWGIIATGDAYMDVSNNVICHNGNCGFAVWDSAAHGALAGNIIFENGWKEEWVCPCVGVWINQTAPGFSITHNDVWNNTAGNYEGIPDQTGINGNISADPRFINLDTFELDEASPCIDAGVPVAIDVDGTRSDMGVRGGSLGRPQSDRR